jgi:hypothetical protein
MYASFGYRYPEGKRNSRLEEIIVTGVGGRKKRGGRRRR